MLYRILHRDHHRTGAAWCIYPMYDFAHGQSDAIEGITHSICTLEFEDHRPLYDWFVEELELPHRPRQYEFARLNMSLHGDEQAETPASRDRGARPRLGRPRMPTIAGMRRRGFTPAAIRNFCERIGVAKKNSTVDYALLEHCLREDLEQHAPRVMAVLRP